MMRRVPGHAPPRPASGRAKVGGHRSRVKSGGAPFVVVDRPSRWTVRCAGPKTRHDGGTWKQMSSAERQLLMDERAVQRALARIARVIVENNSGVQGLSIVGIQRRGVELAARIAGEIERAEGAR